VTEQAQSFDVVIIGGTWDLFRYPGIRSDSSIFTLSFPYEPEVGHQAAVERAAELLRRRDRLPVRPDHRGDGVRAAGLGLGLAQAPSGEREGDADERDDRTEY
jgi:hypothetical protein